MKQYVVLKQKILNNAKNFFFEDNRRLKYHTERNFEKPVVSILRKCSNYGSFQILVFILICASGKL